MRVIRSGGAGRRGGGMISCFAVPKRSGIAAPLRSVLQGKFRALEDAFVDFRGAVACTRSGDVLYVIVRGDDDGGDGDGDWVSGSGWRARD